MPSSPRSVRPYLAIARRLGDRLRAAVRPIRVLDALRWDESVEPDFLAANGRRLPSITAASYRPLTFVPAAKRVELLDLEFDVHNRLGRGDPLARFLTRRCRQARAAVEMLCVRGTPEFSRRSKELYGEPTREEIAVVESVFAELAKSTHAPSAEAPDLDAVAAAGLLTFRLRQSLSGAGRFQIRVGRDLASQAAARGRSITICRDARFCRADVLSLEAHEGWVHLGTTLNARRQRVCGFLSHGLPATTATQEGLAVLCELLAGVCHAGRVRRLLARFRAVRLAGDGADFRDIYRFFLGESDDPRDAFRQAARTYRGSLPHGAGPFAKDQTYALGLVRLLRFAQSAMRSGQLARLPLLFAGKIALADQPLLKAAIEAGILQRPRFVPPPFRDSIALAARLHALPHPPHVLPKPYVHEKSAKLPGSRAAGPVLFLDDDTSHLRATG
ncbi:MAG TPA: tyrosine/phenylalanine carboxypeptidase domain-containing protein [Gemmataceae bacterium]|nr:tyrosine/phenylalanine carboxypeptidase domain-containing protein [Gemmataceae bacterium]